MGSTIRATDSTAPAPGGDDDEPCVVSWSWQTRALRRAAGNCVLYTYTTNLHTDGGSYQGRWHSRASTGTGTLTVTHRVLGWTAWTEGDQATLSLRAICRVAGVSAVALHGIDARSACSV